MRPIREFLWTEDRVEHIARHGIDPHEVEEVFLGNPLVEKTKSRGKNPVYVAFGQTLKGRYLFCLVARFPGGVGWVVTARPMTVSERRRYRLWRNR